MLGTNASTFATAASSILSAAISPAKLLIDIGLAAKKLKERSDIQGAHHLFRAGQADAALDAIVRLIDRELKLLAVDMGKQAASIVGSAFAMGPAASAANAIVDVLVNIRVYARMAEEMKKGNQLMDAEDYSLELFTVSPVLGCYFLILADTSVWINFSAFDIGTPGWMKTVETLRKRSQPIRDKARQFIREAKYAVSGTEFMKGLQWEATWRNDKLDYLTQHANFDYLANKIHAKVTRAKTKPDKPVVDPSRIYAIAMDKNGNVSRT
jgi:hypothetical protein